MNSQFPPPTSPPFLPHLLHVLSFILPQMSDVQVFVQSVNQVLWVQEETERVRDAMNRITAYSAVEMPGELKEVRTSMSHVTA